MKKEIGIGVVGTNFVSDWLCEASRQVEGVCVSSVYSRKIDTGAAFAKKHSIKNVFVNYQEMLSSPDVQAVYVASPTLLHKEHSMQALRAGKHVLCEKALAVDYTEAGEMISEASKLGLVLAEAMRPAYDPLYDGIFEILDSKPNIERACLSFQKYSSRYDDFKRGIVRNAFDPQMKNSALLDIGIYPLWLAVRAFGEPISVEAMSTRLSNGFDGEGEIRLYYDFCEEFVKIKYSKIRDDESASEIRLKDSTISIDKISEPTNIEICTRCGAKKIKSPHPCQNNMIFELAAFRDFINGDKDLIPYLDVSAALMRTVDRIIAVQKIVTL